MNYADLTFGNIYKTPFKGQGIYIFRHTPVGRHTYLNIYDNIGRFEEHIGDMSPDNGFEVYSIPTDEEITHFEICEKMGKYIPFDEIDHNPLFIN